MKLAVVNGSPRGRKSNSSKIADWITQGMDDVEKVYAADIKRQDESVEKILAADSILFVFPLYTDAMPGLVKAFMEKMACRDFSGKTVTYVIHSGFPEAVQLRMLEKYCIYFSKICGMQLLGCAVMGGTEGGLPSEKRAEKDQRVSVLRYIGRCIKKQKEIDARKTKELSRFESLNKTAQFIIKLMPMNIPWNIKLKLNKAYDRRYDRPHLPEQ